MEWLASIKAVSQMSRKKVCVFFKYFYQNIFICSLSLSLKQQTFLTRIVRLSTKYNPRLRVK